MIYERDCDIKRVRVMVEEVVGECLRTSDSCLN
jgi:hypothetical protein